VSDEQTFGVTAVPDETKGEQPGVLHTLDEPRLEECLESWEERMPRSWRPGRTSSCASRMLPYSAPTKLDLRKAAD